MGDNKEGNAIDSIQDNWIQLFVEETILVHPKFDLLIQVNKKEAKDVVDWFLWYLEI